jgi:NADH-quinone oxidoreductase subunit N
MIVARDLLPVVPALLLVVTGLAVILLEAFSRRQKRSSQSHCALSLAGLALALVATWLIPLPAGCRPCVASLGGSVVGDALARFLALLLIATAVVVVLLAKEYGRKTGTGRGEHYGLTLFAVAGMLGLVSAVELVSLFVALEIMSVSLYALVGMRRTHAQSQEAALKYFVTGAFSSAFLLYGIALLYGVTGTTNLTGIAAALASPARDPGTLSVALGLLLVGFGFKIGSVPFHMWVPDVYEGAPTTVTALMAAAVKAAAFGALLRVSFVGLAPLAHKWQPVLAGLAILSMVVGNLAALAQSNLKRLLAYSSVAHAGYMLTAFVATPAQAVEAVGFYLAGYAAVSVGAFGALAALARDDREPTTLADLSGLAERRPALAAAMAVFMFSLTGVPVTAGFVGKLMVFKAAVSGGWVVLALTGVAMSVVSAYYYLRVVVAMYMQAPTSENWPRIDAAAATALALATLVILWLGVYPGPVLDWARSAALFPR